MRLLTIVAAALLTSIHPLAAQAPVAPPPDKSVMAIVDGKPFTETDFNTLTVVMDPKMRDAAGKNPEEMLRLYGFLRKLADLAEKEGLPAQTPYKEKLEVTRMTLLANAMLDWQSNGMPVMPDDQKKYYDDNIAKYREAKLKMIFIPYSNPAEEALALSKAQTAAARAKKGEDFVKLVKEFSKHSESAQKDGDFGPIKASENLPQHIKDAIFSLGPGKISDPVKHANGYYIFRMEQVTTDPYDQVKDQIFNEIKDIRKNEWLKKIRESVQVKMVNPPPASPATP